MCQQEVSTGHRKEIIIYLYVFLQMLLNVIIKGNYGIWLVCSLAVCGQILPITHSLEIILSPSALLSLLYRLKCWLQEKPLTKEENKFALK